jgi:hypothetical protein
MRITAATPSSTPAVPYQQRCRSKGSDIPRGWVVTKSHLPCRVQVCAVSVLCILYVYFMLGNVGDQRHKMFSIFLHIPSGCLRALANAQLRAGDGQDGDQEEAPREVASPATKVSANIVIACGGTQL